MPATPALQPRRAALLMLVSVALFALMDAGLKTLSAHYPPFQVAAMRGLSSCMATSVAEVVELQRQPEVLAPQ